MSEYCNSGQDNGVQSCSNNLNHGKNSSMWLLSEKLEDSVECINLGHVILYYLKLTEPINQWDKNDYNFVLFKAR